jgi:hypothetical protein
MSCCENIPDQSHLPYLYMLTVDTSIGVHGIDADVVVAHPQI